MKSIRGAVIAAVAAGALVGSAQAQTYFPDDVQTSGCSIDRVEFDGWFADGAVVPNGVVREANSLNPGFANAQENTSCDFYKWSAQMFLWITSAYENAEEPAPRRVLDSPLFFGVSADVDGRRTLLPNTEGLVLATRTEKTDGSRAFAEQIDELGQAGGAAVLESVKGSLVYYGVHVNNVYAAMADKAKTVPGFNPTRFPISEEDLAAITGETPLPAQDALAMELKTSWVEADTLGSTQGYVLIDAVIPNFVRERGAEVYRQDPKTPTRETRLALVGMHVVGSVAGHPELVWASFEHVDNAPDVAFDYVADTGKVKTASPPPGSGWVFSAAAQAAPDANIERQAQCTPGQFGYDCGDYPEPKPKPGDIVGLPGQTLGPSTVARENPWGSVGSFAFGFAGIENFQNDAAFDATIAAAKQAVAENNSEIIALNAGIRGLLDDADVRRNYFLLGAVWTKTGAVPGGLDPVTQIGSLTMANATMETFHQDNPPGFPAGCFSCHGIAEGDTALGVSHIYSALTTVAASGRN
ncbi:MAG: hypothetical protein ACFB2Z_01475 [Maricaulaceae bacterium]